MQNLSDLYKLFVCYETRDVRVEWVSRPTFYFALVTMDKVSITEYVRGVAEKVTEAKGVELVNVETAGTKKDLVVRIFIDKDGGVTLEDCTLISRATEEILDGEDVIPTRYVLEVSSPGIERELYSLADFVKFTGQLAKIKLSSEIDGQKNFVGVISSVDGDKITVEDRTSGTISFDYATVAKANLKIDLSKEFGHK